MTATQQKRARKARGAVLDVAHPQLTATLTASSRLPSEMAPVRVINHVRYAGRPTVDPDLYGFGVLANVSAAYELCSVCCGDSYTRMLQDGSGQTTASRSQLKPVGQPCPFCGGTAVLVEDPSDGGWSRIGEHGVYQWLFNGPEGAHSQSTSPVPV